MKNTTKAILVVGGGAAGYFAAIAASEFGPSCQVTLIESGKSPLRKVAISGAGRCNVTHGCYDPKQLIQGYPRGGRELLGPFSKFQPKDTTAWFESRGVKLKTESDRRVFPVSDDSKSIVDCLESERVKKGIELKCRTKLVNLAFDQSRERFKAGLKGSNKKTSAYFDMVVLATGSAKIGYELASELGHSIAPLAPSLFTFKVRDSRISDLAGVSKEDVSLELRVLGTKKFAERGPLLITHWGFSGPGVIRLSAWAARELAESGYSANLRISWCPELSEQQILEGLNLFRKSRPQRVVANNAQFEIPKRLWKNICVASGIEQETFAEMRKSQASNLVQEIVNSTFEVTGKGEFKEEFVTCGGVELREVDFRTMESKIIPGLFFAGEILDIDGITGGFNFQSAWTTGWLAGREIGLRFN